MRPTATAVPPRPVLAVALALTALVTGTAAGADPAPVVREGHGRDTEAARAAAAAARTALAAPVPDLATRGDLRLRLGDPSALAALNSLLKQGVSARVAGGAAVLPASTEILDAGFDWSGTADANGVVRVVNSGPVTAGAPDYGFVYVPVWFTDLGSGVRVEQTYAAGNPLLSGHWRALSDGSGGPAAAAGQASVVSGPRAVLFGTEPLFRDHPKGEFAQVGRALFTVGAARGGSVEESG